MMARRFEGGAVGPRSVKASAGLARRAADEWPYPWVFSPPGAQDIRASGTIAAPATNTQAVVLLYTVPKGFWFVWRGLVQEFHGPAGMFVPGSGDIVWSLDVNTPLGVTSPQGTQVEYYGRELVPLGSSVFGPWPVEGERVFEPGSDIRSKVILPTPTITPGLPQSFTSMLTGWLVPQNLFWR